MLSYSLQSLLQYALYITLICTVSYSLQFFCMCCILHGSALTCCLCYDDSIKLLGKNPPLQNHSLSVSLSPREISSILLINPCLWACSMTAWWQNTYCSGTWIEKARWDLILRTVSFMSTVPTSSNRRRQMSTVTNVPGMLKTIKTLWSRWTTMKYMPIFYDFMMPFKIKINLVLFLHPWKQKRHCSKYSK